jgi:hypothetical protein
MLHFGQIGGGEFFGMGSPFHQGGSSTVSVTVNSLKREKRVIMILRPCRVNSESIQSSRQNFETRIICLSIPAEVPQATVEG